MDEIDGRSSVYVDTNIFIYFIEATPDMFERVVALLNHANRVGARLVTCELTVAECLYKPHRDGDAELIAVYEKLFASGGVEITPAMVAAERAGTTEDLLAKELAKCSNNLLLSRRTIAELGVAVPPDVCLAYGTRSH